LMNTDTAKKYPSKKALAFDSVAIKNRIQAMVYHTTFVRANALASPFII
jgi:hypothetical protein